MRAIGIEIFDDQRALARASLSRRENNGNDALTARRKTACAGIAGDLEIASHSDAPDAQRICGRGIIAECDGLRGAGRSHLLGCISQS